MVCASPKYIYLACPYSDPDPEVRIRRFNQASAVAGELMKQGHIVFSPISHSHPVAMACKMPGDWEFWQDQDRAFLEWCDEVHILMLPGWLSSHGVRAERDIAMGMRKPVYYIDFVP